jgi:type II secretory pathway component GspD/PulD (secretin)
MLRRQTLAGLVVALLPVLALAEPAAPEARDKEAPAAEKVRQQLDQPVTLEVGDQPLGATLNQLREKAKLNFVVDRLTLQQLGLDPDQLLVSVNLKGVKVKTALRAILGPNNLGYAIVGDTVFVSSDDMAMARQLKQRVSLDVEKTDLAAALKKLSKETAANVVLDSRVAEKLAQTEVTLQLDDVPLENAVRLIAESASLKPVKVGNVLLVTTKAIAAELRKESEPQPQVPGGGMLSDMDVVNFGQIRLWRQGGMVFRAVGGLGGININGGDITQPGTAVPPLDRPPDKDGPVEEPAPAKDKKN